MITIICPSRTRPQNIGQLIESIVDTADSTEVYTYIVVDGTDPASRYPEYVAEAARWGRPIELQGERKGLVATLNRAAEKVLDWSVPGDWIGFWGDDHRARTKGWAGKMLATTTPETDLLWANDGKQGRNLATAMLMPAELVRQRGWFAPPEYHHYYWDQWLTNNAKHPVYLDNVLIEHQHPVWGFNNNDALYTETQQLWWNHDKNVHEQLTASGKYINVNN